MATVADKIKKDIKNAKGVAGTVIRFDVCFETDLMRRENAKRYSYAALFTNNRWYLTGTRGFGDGRTEFDYAELLRILASDERVENIAVAVEFEAIEA